MTISEQLSALANAADAVLKPDDNPVTLRHGDAAVLMLHEAAAVLTMREGQVTTLREALAIYADEKFYDQLPPPSLAVDDRGQRARWILRLTEDGAT